MTAPCPILRYHGGKWKIADWVTSHFPPHAVYVEPFGGAAGVLLRKTRSRAEVYNDMDGEIVNVFRVLRDQQQANQLRDACLLTPYARAEFDLAQEPSDDPVEQARRTLFRAWSSFGSAGATRGRTGMRTFTKPDKRYTPVAGAWLRLADAIPVFTKRLADAIPVFTKRLAGVVIENRPAIDVMKQHDTPDTLHYVDPPYLPETRTFDGGRYYRHELTPQDHATLLNELLQLQGTVVLSGYDSELYKDLLSGWACHRLGTTGSSRFGSVSRTECLWVSPGKEVQASLFPSTAMIKP